jgi:hypothetical protein
LGGNRLVAAHACAMLTDFLAGQLRYFALAFDAQWGGATSYALDEKTLKDVWN